MLISVLLAWQEREESYDMGNIDGPLDQEMHEIHKATASFKQPVQITQRLHQSIMTAFGEAKKDGAKRSALKQQLTMLCDEGRSHPQYWALKTELDSLDGGEDDSDTLTTFTDNGLAGDGNLGDFDNI